MLPELNRFAQDALKRQSPFKKFLIQMHGLLHRFIFPNKQTNWSRFLKDSGLIAIGNEIQKMIESFDLSKSKAITELTQGNDENTRVPLESKIEAILQNLGPTAQKIVQLLGERSDPELVRAVSKK